MENNKDMDVGVEKCGGGLLKKNGIEESIINDIKYIVAYPPIDFTRTFEELANSEIDIYFHFNNEIGKNTCRANCSHCYFKSRPRFDIPLEKAMNITSSLRQQGFNIGLTPADTFSKGFLTSIKRELELRNEKAGSAFRLKEIGKAARTSGRPLVENDWVEQLDLSSELGYRSIIITAHDVANTEVPLQGITPGEVVQKTIYNVQAWNSAQKNNEDIFALSTTFTIGSYNLDLEVMRKMVQRGIENNIDVVRFNCFANFLDKDDLKDYEMSKEQIQQFGSYLAILCKETEKESLKLGLSEDIGDAFLVPELMPYLSPEWQEREVGRCRAGYRLFAMIEVDGKIVVTGCVDAREPILGELIEGTDGAYSIKRDYEKIEELRQGILNRSLYACYGGVGKEREDNAGFCVNKEVEKKLFT